MTKQEIFIAKIKRMFYLHQLFKESLHELRTSESAIEIAATARANKVKNFTDIRVISADLIRSMDSYLLKLKSTMEPDTWRNILMHLGSEELIEVGLLLDELANIHDPGTIEQIQLSIKKLSKPTT